MTFHFEIRAPIGSGALGMGLSEPFDGCHFEVPDGLLQLVVQGDGELDDDNRTIRALRPERWWVEGRQS